MDEKKTPASRDAPAPVDDDRREFLRRSIYAAYATPLITMLLVEKAAAAPSGGNNGRCSPKWCRNHPDADCCQ
jgi:hypothetical protein